MLPREDTGTDAEVWEDCSSAQHCWQLREKQGRRERTDALVLRTIVY